jgi:putrescine transport system substrate-binding protein
MAAFRGRRARCLTLLLTFVGLVGCGDNASPPVEPEQVVNFYNWYSDISPRALPDFTTATGIDVIHDVYDDDRTLEAKLLVGHAGYDLVVPASSTFGKLRAAGLLRPLERGRLHNYQGLDPYLLDKLAEVDPNNRYGVPYSWGTTGLGFNAAQVIAHAPDAPLDSWALIFSPDVLRKLRECGVAMLDSPGDVVPVALRYLGRDPASESLTDLDDAIAMLAAVQPYIRYFDSSQSLDDLANGEICLAVMWSGSVFQARRASAGLDLRYVVPKEGSLLWFEVLAIPADATHVDNAHRLIDYLLDPRVATGYTDATFYASAIVSARQAVDAAVRDEEAVYPAPETRQRLFAISTETPDYAQQRLRRWTAMKAGQIH